MGIFNDRLNEAMREKGINAATLSAKSGISKACISQYVNNIYIAKQPHLFKLASALGVSPTWLMGADITAPGVDFETYPHDILSLSFLAMKRYNATEDKALAMLAKETNLKLTEIKMLKHGYLCAPSSSVETICTFFEIPAEILFMRVLLTNPDDTIEVDETFECEKNETSEDVMCADFLQMVQQKKYDTIFYTCSQKGIPEALFFDFVEIVKQHTKLSLPPKDTSDKKPDKIIRYRAAKDGDANSERCDSNVPAKIEEYKKTSSTDEKPFK